MERAAWSEGSVINLCSCRQVVQQGGWLVVGLTVGWLVWNVDWLTGLLVG